MVGVCLHEPGAPAPSGVVAAALIEAAV